MKATRSTVTVHASLDRAIVERLHLKARADRWSLPIDAFAAALESSARKAFASEPADTRQLERYLESLHVEDLALACACAQGSEPAWEHFIREHRPVLYRAADAIDPSGGSRDLADSLYGELFGLDVRDGERRSHFRYFHGRSSLATWLRAVLSQRHVDRIRSVRRHDPLPEDEAPGAISAPPDEVVPQRAEYVSVMRGGVTTAVATLEARDRLRLRCYCAGNGRWLTDRTDVPRIRSHRVTTSERIRREILREGRGRAPPAEHERYTNCRVLCLRRRRFCVVGFGRAAGPELGVRDGARDWGLTPHAGSRGRIVPRVGEVQCSALTPKRWPRGPMADCRRAMPQRSSPHPPTASGARRCRHVRAHDARRPAANRSGTRHSAMAHPGGDRGNRGRALGWIPGSDSRLSQTSDGTLATRELETLPSQPSSAVEGPRRKPRTPERRQARQLHARSARMPSAQPRELEQRQTRDEVRKEPQTFAPVPHGGARPRPAREADQANQRVETFQERAAAPAPATARPPPAGGAADDCSSTG